MSGIRIFGIIVGVIGLLFTLLNYRGVKWRRNNFILLLIFNFVLISISLNPAILNILRDMMAMKTSEWGRLLSLLVLSNIIVIFSIIYLKSKLDCYKIQFDELTKALGKRTLSIEEQESIKEVMVVIPAYNEAENINLLIPSIPKKIGGKEIGVLVIDDGSIDDTGKIGDQHGAVVLRNPINMGQGAALKLGYEFLLSQSVKIFVTMDADNQHSPMDIPLLVAPILEGKADFVVGSRTIGKRIGKNDIRFLGLLLFNFILRHLLKENISDCSSGFRAFKTEIIKNISLKESQYQSAELIIETVKKGYSIKEAPVIIHKRSHGQSKKGTDFKYGINFARVILKTWWRH